MPFDALDYLTLVQEAHHQLTRGAEVGEIWYALDALREANPSNAMVPLPERKLKTLKQLSSGLDAKTTLHLVHSPDQGAPVVRSLAIRRRRDGR